MANHCEDNERDRAKGDACELRFCKKLIASKCTIEGCHQWISDALGLACMPLPLNSDGDVSFIVGGGRVLAEVKEKYPDSQDTYGLEDYRWVKLWRERSKFDHVIYVIFDTKLQKWVAADTVLLAAKIQDGTAFLQKDKTWRNGMDTVEPTWHWLASLWSDDMGLWANPKRYEARMAIAAGKQFEYLNGETILSWRANG